MTDTNCAAVVAICVITAMTQLGVGCRSGGSRKRQRTARTNLEIAAMIAIREISAVAKLRVGTSMRGGRKRNITKALQTDCSDVRAGAGSSAAVPQQRIGVDASTGRKID